MYRNANERTYFWSSEDLDDASFHCFDFTCDILNVVRVTKLSGKLGTQNVYFTSNIMDSL